MKYQEIEQKSGTRSCQEDILSGRNVYC